MSQISGNGGVLGGSSGIGGMESVGGGGAAQQSSLGPFTPAFGGGPQVQAYVNTGTQDERVRLYLGGLYNRVSFQTVAVDAAYPTSSVLALEYSMDGNNWFAPASAVETSAAGIKAGNDSTGYVWASVKVKTISAGRALVTLTGSNTTA